MDKAAQLFYFLRNMWILIIKKLIKKDGCLDISVNIYYYIKYSWYHLMIIL